MSQKEVDRLDIIQQVISKRLTQVEASKRLGLSARQVRNLRRQYEREGAKGLISKRRGEPSNNTLSKAIKAEVIRLSQTRYVGFGPTFLHEKLHDEHGLHLSVESVRQLMIKEGLWATKKRATVRHHPMRTRRPAQGELVQIDGSPHDWFEGRAPSCCLLVFIDDATSKLMMLHFVEVESTQGYFDATENYIKQHGRPVAFYSDKHGIFRVNIPEANISTGETQFGRACRELGIELICANSPQAKGRVERANRTLQDRLIKEMRLKGISSIEDANGFLPAFMRAHNQRFAVKAANPTDAHRKSAPNQTTMDLIFSTQSKRKLSKNLEASYNNVIYQIQTNSPCYSMRKATITVCDKQGAVTLLYKNKVLKYQTFDKHNRPTAIADSKTLGQALKKTTPQKPSADHPWRHYSSRKTPRRSTSRRCTPSP
jgi:transposase